MSCCSIDSVNTQSWFRETPCQFLPAVPAAGTAAVVLMVVHSSLHIFVVEAKFFRIRDELCGFLGCKF